MVELEDLIKERGRITNIDYQTYWIYKELKHTNALLEEQIKVNRYLVRLIEHMLEKSDNPERMRQAVKMEMGRGIR